jgi:hypothetical protein
VTDPLSHTQIAPAERLSTAAEFQRLADVPPKIEWFANLGNRSNERAYKNAIQDFMRFTGIARPEDFRIVTNGACHQLASSSLRIVVSIIWG